MGFIVIIDSFCWSPRSEIEPSLRGSVSTVTFEFYFSKIGALLPWAKSLYISSGVRRSTYEGLFNAMLNESNFFYFEVLKDLSLIEAFFVCFI